MSFICNTLSPPPSQPPLKKLLHADLLAAVADRRARARAAYHVHLRFQRHRGEPGHTQDLT